MAALVNGCVQATVSATVQSVADRSAAGFAGAGWYRCGSGEAGEPGLGEASDVADFEQDLGGGAGGDAGNGGQGRSTLTDEFGKFDFGGFVLGQHLSEHGASVLDQVQSQAVDWVVVDAAGVKVG
jgi:hypothetical protein